MNLLSDGVSCSHREGVVSNKRKDQDTRFSDANMMSDVFVFIVKTDASVIVEHSGEWVRLPALRVTDVLLESHCIVDEHRWHHAS